MEVPGTELPSHAVQLMDRMVNEFGCSPSIANLAQYYFYNLNESAYKKFRITDTEAKAFVENAKAHNQRLLAERSTQTVFEEDMEALWELEQNYSIPTRIYKIRAKESGAFGMRLDSYLLDELDQLVGILSALNPSKEVDAVVDFFKTMTVDLRKMADDLCYAFTKCYSHWFLFD